MIFFEKMRNFFMIFFKKYGLFWQKIIQIPKKSTSPPPPFFASTLIPRRKYFENRNFILLASVSFQPLGGPSKDPREGVGGM